MLNAVCEADVDHTAELAASISFAGVQQQPAMRIAMIGGYAPTRCGIATFTTDVVQAVGLSAPTCGIDVYAVQGRGLTTKFMDPVRGVIREGEVESFVATAAVIEASNPDVICLQHEFGLFGGPAGDLILTLLDRVSAPVIVTLHTVLAAPEPDQRRVMDRLIARASKLVVMTQRACTQLREVYGVSDEQIALIPHGVPDRPFGRSAHFKRLNGVSDNRVMMTFGLLSPGKGIETVIAALPAIVQKFPDTLYYVVGATHPNLVAREGEVYRDSLKKLADGLGVSDHIRWVDAFLGTDELLDLIEMADIYITPYLGAAQATSGTLAYAVALGKAVISTPYFHATELLDNEHGVLIPFSDPSATAQAVTALFGDPDRLAAIQRRAYARGRAMVWPEFATSTLDLLSRVKESTQAKAIVRTGRVTQAGYEAVLRLSDDTGIAQHARLAVPDRRHGYCIDDNARALMLAAGAKDGRLAELAYRYASFVDHAWNPDQQSFRNFMSFSRVWLEEQGSDDSNGRALWALGRVAATSSDADLRAWAGKLYDESAPLALALGSPRALAFAALGALERIGAGTTHDVAQATIVRCAVVLNDLYDRSKRDGWKWFESSLAYDNARLPEASIRIGLATQDEATLARGLNALEWLMTKQTGVGQVFRPVGSSGFGELYTIKPFDQQPVDVWAAIDACDAAFDATCDRRWINHAQHAYNWFFGANDRGAVMADAATGRCRDGLTPRGLNLNEGAESTLSFLLANRRLAELIGNSSGA